MIWSFEQKKDLIHLDYDCTGLLERIWVGYLANGASRSQSIDRHSKMGGGRGLLGDGCICARINSNRHFVITQVLGLFSDLNVY